MPRLIPLVVLVVALATAGCARFEPATRAALATAPATEPTASVTPTPQFATTSIVGFLNPAALALMSEREKAEAASAQYYALQFGRPGAPRAWSGDAGASGEVTVGPFVRVNQLDCRDFTNTVRVGNAEYPRAGTACREAGDEWTVVATN